MHRRTQQKRECKQFCSHQIVVHQPVITTTARIENFYINNNTNNNIPLGAINNIAYIYI